MGLARTGHLLIMGVILFTANEELESQSIGLGLSRVCLEPQAVVLVVGETSINAQNFY